MTDENHTTHLATLADLAGHVGQPLGTSAWLRIEQDRINTFADATDDHQWIHVDVERANAESPFGGPVAHGYLALSLIIPLWTQVLRVDSVTTAVNYGLNKVRFTSPVPAGGRVRLAAALKEYRELPKGDVQIAVEGIIELKGSERPAVVAEAIYRMLE
ncbi:MaoC family dehydratase [Mycolicibacter algericus]|uniref:MaoC family dehydratase n=2 Tax=Mycolicibacter algericus TaxID=1288388 RepID=A0A7I9YAQ7_MYCAL|nr:MaoC family dehydratase [Mycolicibacter algericus]OQZ94052.1 dehydratase [Mycolicibacter algericus DSM 45454]GFG85582.1 MaoC family dehydratase [Mycolicibacter algericus]